MGDELFSLDTVRDFMISRGGKVKNHELVTHFKRFLNDPHNKVANRSKFKDFVNTLASVKLDESGEKLLVLKRKFRESGDLSASTNKGKETDSYVERPKKRPPKSFPSALEGESSTDPEPAAAEAGGGDASRDAVVADAVPAPDEPPASIADQDEDKENVPEESMMEDGGITIVTDRSSSPAAAEATSSEMLMLGPVIGESTTDSPSRETSPESMMTAESAAPPLSREPSSGTIEEVTVDSTDTLQVAELDQAPVTDTVKLPTPELDQADTVKLPTPEWDQADTVKLPTPEWDQAPAPDTIKLPTPEWDQAAPPPSTPAAPTPNKGPPMSVKERAKHLNKMQSDSDLTQVKSRKQDTPKGGTDDDSNSVSSVGTITLDAAGREWMITCSTGHYQDIYKLLNKNQELARRKDFITGFNALHWAAKHGKSDVIKLLCGTGLLNINARSNGGYTALHLAAMHGHEDIIELLVQGYGADPNIRDYSGKKPKQYLRNSASTRAQQLLQPRRRQQQAMNQQYNFKRQGSYSNKIQKSGYFGIIPGPAVRNSWASNASDTASEKDRESPSPIPSPVPSPRTRRKASLPNEERIKMPPPQQAPPRRKKKRPGSKEFGQLGHASSYSEMPPTRSGSLPEISHAVSETGLSSAKSMFI